MTLDPYELISSEDRLSYEFNSTGPKGKIRKIVQYSRLKSVGIKVYNLGFGDYSEDTGEINDLTVSNNKDRNSILETVASTVPHFFKEYPDAKITFNGSTESRTRLYVMEISKRLADFSEYDIQGLKEGNGWESFKKNGRYKAILVTPRKDVN